MAAAQGGRADKDRDRSPEEMTLKDAFKYVSLTRVSLIERREGWFLRFNGATSGVFISDNQNGAFEPSPEAIEHVKHRAKAGSHAHKAALLICAAAALGVDVKIMSDRAESSFSASWRVVVRG